MCVTAVASTVAVQRSPAFAGPVSASAARRRRGDGRAAGREDDRRRRERAAVVARDRQPLDAARVGLAQDDERRVVEVAAQVGGDGADAPAPAETGKLPVTALGWLPPPVGVSVAFQASPLRGMPLSDSVAAVRRTPAAVVGEPPPAGVIASEAESAPAATLRMTMSRPCGRGRVVRRGVDEPARSAATSLAFVLSARELEVHAVDRQDEDVAVGDGAAVGTVDDGRARRRLHDRRERIDA